MPVTKLSYFEIFSQVFSYQIPILEEPIVRLSFQLAKPYQTLGVFVTHGKRLIFENAQ